MSTVNQVAITSTTTTTGEISIRTILITIITTALSQVQQRIRYSTAIWTAIRMWTALSRTTTLQVTVRIRKNQTFGTRISTQRLTTMLITVHIVVIPPVVDLVVFLAADSGHTEIIILKEGGCPWTIMLMVVVVTITITERTILIPTMSTPRTLTGIIIMVGMLTTIIGLQAMGTTPKVKVLRRSDRRPRGLVGKKILILHSDY